MSRPSWGLPGDDDSGVLAELPTVESLIARMDALLVQLREQQDPRRFFHATYLRTTRAVGAELAAGGFLDTAWVQRWDVVFAGFYLDALEAYRRGGRVPGPWAVAFGAGAAVPPLRRVLLGMNAHINYDLPQALLAGPAPRSGKPPGHQAVPRRGPGQGLGQRPRARPSPTAGRGRLPGAARRTRAAGHRPGRRSGQAGAGAAPARHPRLRDHAVSPWRRRGYGSRRTGPSGRRPVDDPSAEP